MDKSSDYFTELKPRLAKERFQALAEADGLLPVEWGGKHLCRITNGGIIRYKPDDVTDWKMEDALHTPAFPPF